MGPQSDGEWTVGTLKEYTTGMIDSLREYTTGLISALATTHALQMADLKETLQQRYDAQVKAGEIAFNASQTALAAGLTASHQGVETALAAAKEATGKAEMNASVQFTQFRTETNLQIKALGDKMDTGVGGITKQVGALTDRMNTGAGVTTGTTEQRANTRMDNGQLVGVLGFLVAAIAVAASFVR